MAAGRSATPGPQSGSDAEVGSPVPLRAAKSACNRASGTASAVKAGIWLRPMRTVAMKASTVATLRNDGYGPCPRPAAPWHPAHWDANPAESPAVAPVDAPARGQSTDAG